MSEDIFRRNGQVVKRTRWEDFKYGVLYRIKDFFKTLQCWPHYNWNKNYKNLVKTAVKSYPFQFDYSEEIFVESLRNLRAYLKKRLVCADEEYDRMLKWLDLAIKIMDKVNSTGEFEDYSLFYYDGYIDLVDDENDPNVSKVDTSHSIYHCNVNVNTRNISRFMNEKYFKAYTYHPHELYIVKARHLFYKIVFQKGYEWWD